MTSINVCGIFLIRQNLTEIVKQIFGTEEKMYYYKKLLKAVMIF